MCGIRDKKVQRHLLSRHDLIFKHTVDEAEFHETDAQNVHCLQRQLSHCYRCDGNHDPQLCTFITEQCKKWGHIERICRTKKRELKAGPIGEHKEL